MGSLARLARISTLAGSATLVSMEATVFYSRNDGPASESQKNCQFLEPKSAAAQECSKHDEEEDPKSALTAKCSPKMAPQFDGLNFYETLISSQR
ncbi:unnamed protein product [Sphagnum compactum]